MNYRIEFRKKAIISRLFDSDRRLTDFLFEPKTAELRERPPILLEESWDLLPEERVLVRAALDVWDGSGHAFLAELLSELSEASLHRLALTLHGVRKFKRLSSLRNVAAGTPFEASKNEPA